MRDVQMVAGMRWYSFSGDKVMEKFLMQHFGEHFNTMFYGMDKQFYTHVLTSAAESVLPPVVSFSSAPVRTGGLRHR